MKQSRILFLCALLIGSCTTALGQTELHGAWNWLSTEYPDGTVTNPGDLGHTVQHQFLPDGSYTLLHDVVVQEVGTWSAGNVLIETENGWICITYISTSTGESWDDWYRL